MSVNKYIYESPDKGDTIYQRLPGTSERELYDQRTPDGRPLYDHVMEDKLWGDIRRAARTNPTLQEALERAKIIYHLSKE